MLKELLGESLDVFSLIGAVVTGAFAIKTGLCFCKFVTGHFLSGPLGLSADLKNAGTWAVVTGCTDGIGKAFAEQLAARGLNVVLLSRTLSKLEELAKHIEEKSNVSTRVIAVDFSHSNIYDEIESMLNGLDIGVLVNNVGMISEHPEFFGDLDTVMVESTINCNALSLAKMTHIVLPKMVQKKAGYIINVGSYAGIVPMPLWAMYSGTKAFVDLFSQSLQAEYADRGIVIQSLRPFGVATKMGEIKEPAPFVPSPTTYVKDALNTVGLLSVTTGYWAHSIQGVLMNLVPMFVIKKAMMASRERGLKKKAAASKTE